MKQTPRTEENENRRKHLFLKQHKHIVTMNKYINWTGLIGLWENGTFFTSVDNGDSDSGFEKRVVAILL